jgi:hypothetical protein
VIAAKAAKATKRAAELQARRDARSSREWLALFEARLQRDEAREARHADQVIQAARRERARRDRRRTRQRARDTVSNSFIRRKLRKNGLIGPNQPIPPALYEAMRPLLLLRRELQKEPT